MSMLHEVVETMDNRTMTECPRCECEQPWDKLLSFQLSPALRKIAIPGKFETFSRPDISMSQVGAGLGLAASLVSSNNNLLLLFLVKADSRVTRSYSIASQTSFTTSIFIL